MMDKYVITRMKEVDMHTKCVLDVLSKTDALDSHTLSSFNRL